MTREEKFTALLEEIRAAKEEDQATLAVWKKANKRLTDANAAMQTFISQETRLGS